MSDRFPSRIWVAPKKYVGAGYKCFHNPVEDLPSYVPSALLDELEKKLAQEREKAAALLFALERIASRGLVNTTYMKVAEEAMAKYREVKK